MTKTDLIDDSAASRSLIEKLEAEKRFGGELEITSTYNMALNKAIAIIRQHKAEQEGVRGAMAVEAEYAADLRRGEISEDKIIGSISGNIASYIEDKTDIALGRDLKFSAELYALAISGSTKLVSVSLEKCAEAAYLESKVVWTGSAHKLGNATDVAKAVLDAAGIKYVD